MGQIRIKLKKNNNISSKSYGLYYGYVEPYNTMTVDDLTDHVAMDSKIERSEVSEISHALLKQIKQLVCNGHSIEIPHFGTIRMGLESKPADSYAAYNASKHVKGAHIVFTPCTELKSEVRKVKFFCVKSKAQATTEPEPATEPTNP